MHYIKSTNTFVCVYILECQTNNVGTRQSNETSKHQIHKTLTPSSLFIMLNALNAYAFVFVYAYNTLDTIVYVA